MKFWNWIKGVFNLDKLIPKATATEVTETKYFLISHPLGLKPSKLERFDILFERFCGATDMATYGHSMTQDKGVTIYLVDPGWLDHKFGNQQGGYRMYGMTVRTSKGSDIYLCSLKDGHFYHEISHAMIYGVATGRYSVSPALHEAWAVAMAKLAERGGPPSPTMETVRAGTTFKRQLSQRVRRATMDHVLCPWCGYRMEDLWEYGVEDGCCLHIDCPGCGKPVTLSCSVSVMYEIEKDTTT